MIIGVDAGALSIRDERLKVGVWRVTYNLLRELGKIDIRNEYRLYTFLPIDREVMSVFGPRMKNVVVRPSLAWSTIQLPIELRRHPVDVFLGLSQMLPRSTSRNIGFIYDLGFIRNPDAYPGSLKKLISQTSQLVERADDIVAISQSTKKDIIEHYKIEKKNVSVAYPGVDGRFTTRGDKHKNRNPYILSVGSLKRGKNVPMALRIFKKFMQISKKQYDFLIIGGDYWNDPDIQHERTGHVKFMGFVPDEELPSYYRGAEALLVTSLWEGFCLPAIEAMACGCPVVYGKVGSLPEIVGNAGSAYNDEQAAVVALTRLQRTVSGIRRSKGFTWGNFAVKIYDLIDSK
jgi:glycosyltransferase involved in cell wall biosynthesis